MLSIDRSMFADFLSRTARLPTKSTLVQLVLSAIVAASITGNAVAAEIYYHSDTHSAETSVSTLSYPVAVKFDLPVPSQTYEITKFGILSEGDAATFPSNTQIAVRVWNANGVHQYTTGAIDLSGQDASLGMRWFDISADHVQVTNSFYMGYQDVGNNQQFGYKVDVPAGSDYGHSYRFKISDWTWSPMPEDFWFNVVVTPVSLAGVTWTGASSLNWSDLGNWTTTVPDNGFSHTFDDSVAGYTNVVANEPLIAAGVLFNNSTYHYTISGAGGISGAATVKKQGAGTATMGSVNTYTGTTTVEAGKLVLQGRNKAMAPVLDNGGADIKGGMLVLDYTGEADPVATVATLITSSYNVAGPNHFDTGKFQSSTADSTHGLGWIDNTATSKISVAYTIYGDADLNGSVGLSDLGKVLTNWGTGTKWADGDVDYSSAVGLSDLGKILTNWGLSVGTLTPAAQAVPEPSMLVLLVALAIFLAARRRF